VIRLENPPNPHDNVDNDSPRIYPSVFPFHTEHSLWCFRFNDLTWCINDSDTDQSASDRYRRRPRTSSHIVIIAMRAIFVRLFVLRDIFSERSFTLERRSWKSQCEYDKKLPRSPTMILRKLTFLQMKCISLVFLSWWSDFSA
jgi:hypothetical protein